ncbi:hypothetical protein FIU94_12710 [Sulfitobacter sp. THAF37]|uniref:hypothetical protein n=1 Tax=Sulfitobacter sp. THAF37 TaxID=2587855 RepID=UPI0012A7E3AF|nr:hypothetical protein [Sulfitobacter sp. THAF37]QFT59688.1 hypothetical protein FIU94_12710 [Sulfitobacter sp. THAF37]
MKHIVIATLLSAGMASSGFAAPAVTLPAGASTSSAALAAGDGSAQVWLTQGKGNGNGKGPKAAKGNGGPKKAKQASPRSGKGPKKEAKPKKAKGKPEKAGKADKNRPTQAKNDAPGQAKKAQKAENRKVRGEDWDRRAEEVLRVTAPADRDVLKILGATALALAGPQLVVADTPVEELITYRNCPPGLAKKTPACVPPGLAKQGVTQDQWLSYDDAEYDRLWLRQRDDYLQRYPTPTENLLLQSAQIAGLFGLDPAPNGQRYALIDGMPVLLEQDDYNGLLLINELAQVVDIDSGVNVAPTAALTQSELSRLYRLPSPAPDVNYAVLNGQVIRLSDSQYETLQLIRIARAAL